ncbi:MAG: thioredoxin family protein [Bacteroidetes bacterium]|nr:thioredoxin family protein [Bacteroidota bacterium]MBU1717844.1 thioredoxin family protein [Bacteroidota bacterium]
MKESKPITIELFSTMTCPNCTILKRMLEDVLPQFGNKFVLKKTSANMPGGMIRTMKLGIHAVPALLIEKKIVFRSVPTREELITVLKTY